MTTTADSPTGIDHTRPRTITGRRKIAILGYTWSVAEAPFDDDSWERWAINDLFALNRPGNINMADVVAAGKVDAWFDLHEPQVVADKKQWLQERHPFPIYLLPGVAEKLGFDVPSYEVFPKGELIGRYGDYITNTISYLLAFAIDQLDGVDGAEIGVYGVDMAVSGEFSAQRPSCEYFIGLAIGKGIPVRLPATSDLLKAAGVYGETHPMQAKMEQRSTELRSRRSQVVAQLEELSMMLHKLDGALENNDHWVQVWFQPSGRDREKGLSPPSDGIASAMQLDG